MSLYSQNETYYRALSYFSQNELSVDGLTREEITRVYRDIITGSFSYDKTSQVIRNSVMGYEILQESPAPEDQAAAADLWPEEDLPQELAPDTITAGGRTYEHAVPWGDKQILYSSHSGHVALQDKSGDVLWDMIPRHGFNKSEVIAAAIPEEDAFVLFSYGDGSTLCMARYDRDGNCEKIAKHPIGRFEIRNVVPVDDGYLLQMTGSTRLLNYASTVEYLQKVHPDGSLGDSITYDSQEEQYYITDMTEYNGCVYLSAYIVPTPDEKKYPYGIKEIAGILGGVREIYDYENKKLPMDKFNQIVKDNFTAVLLRCDPATGMPETFYSVKGSVSSGLSTDDQGRLLWEVETIADTFYSPYTTAFHIGGVSYVYHYTFDEEGQLTGQEKTDALRKFYR